MEEIRKLRGPRVGNKGLVACIIVLVILGGLFYFTYQNQLNQIESLEENYDDLQASYDDLGASYDDLQASYDELDDIVNLNEKKTLSENKIVYIASDAYTSLIYSTPYTGYIQVDFTASGEIYFWVQSSFTNTFYSRYPPSSDDTATSGSFIIPVLPDVTLFFVYNPQSTEASIEITVTYVY